MATKYEYNNTTNSSGLFSDTTYDQGQSFTIGTVGANENFNLSSIKLKMYREGSPGTCYFAIRAVDGSGLPTGADLSTGTTDGDTLTTDSGGEEREITMSSYELQASTKYAVIFYADVSQPGSNAVWFLGLFEVGSVYAGGDYLYESGGWYASSTSDIWFEIWGTASAASGTNQWTNVDDTLRQISEMWVNVNDAWRKVSESWVNVNDAWRRNFTT